MVTKKLLEKLAAKEDILRIKKKLDLLVQSEKRIEEKLDRILEILELFEQEYVQLEELPKKPGNPKKVIH